MAEDNTPVTEPVQEAKKEAPVEHSAPAHTQDYSPHFEHIAKELSKIPEYVVNALREAVPAKEKEPEETQEAVTDQKEKEEIVEPGGNPEKGKSQKKHKIGWGARWHGAK